MRRVVLILIVVILIGLVYLYCIKESETKETLGASPRSSGRVKFAKTDAAEAIYYIVSSNENKNYLSFWPYVKNNVEKLGMVPILIYTGKDTPKKKLKGWVIYKPCPPDLPGNNYARIIRLFAPSLFPDKYCVIADIDSIPLRHKYFTGPLTSIPRKKGWIFWNDWSLGATCTNWPMCFNLAKGSVWAEVFPYSWNDVDEVIRKWITARKNSRHPGFTDQYYFGKHFCLWRKNNPYRFKEYHQNISNLFIGPRSHTTHFPRRIKTHRIKVCKTLEEIEAHKHKSGVAWVSRLKDGMDKTLLKKTLKVLEL